LIRTTYGQFREAFAVRFSEENSLLLFSSPATIIGPSEDLERYIPNSIITISGSVSNDGNFKVVDNSFTGFVTIDPEYNPIVGESPVSVNHSGYAVANDGYPEWPYERVRADSFDFGIGISWVHPITGSPVTETIPGNTPLSTSASITLAIAIGTPGSDAHEWYLSKRSQDNPDIMMVKDPTNGEAVILSFPNETPGILSPARLSRLFKNVHLYVQRNSDQAIQWFDLHANFV
jgi:hypothetical protein